MTGTTAATGYVAISNDKNPWTGVKAAQLNPATADATAAKKGMLDLVVTLNDIKVEMNDGTEVLSITLKVE